MAKINLLLHAPFVKSKSVNKCGWIGGSIMDKLMDGCADGQIEALTISLMMFKKASR